MTDFASAVVFCAFSKRISAWDRASFLLGTLASFCEPHASTPTTLGNKLDAGFGERALDLLASGRSATDLAIGGFKPSNRGALTRLTRVLAG
jgi:hypothetical protein